MQMQSEIAPQNLGQPDGKMIADWLLRKGLESVSQYELLHGYCQKLVELGIPLMRLHVAERAFHPLYGGVGFDWLRETGLSHQHYEHATSPLERWIQSPLYYMLDTSTYEFRQKLTDLQESNPYPL